MALHWDLAKIQNNETLCWQGTEENAAMNKLTDLLIWTCMFVGIPDITEETVLEFWGRLGVVYAEDTKTLGAITFQDLVNHIGLHTNASRYTSAQFYKHQNGIRKEKSRRTLKMAA